ncbi:MAG: thioredoxin family protein [candidate division KSB1 bacterium]|nr:thioredoxin family protein [candidate division KSB1 bacterium]
MPLLSERDKKAIRERLAGLKDPVKLVHFTQELECQFCRETRMLLEELTELSDLLTLEKYNFVTDKEVAQKYGIDKIPATIVMSPSKDYGIRFYGIPSGYEFASLLEDILMVSQGDSGLQPETRKALGAISRPVHIQVFVTPTCPYCPMAVRLAHQMAFESDLITADMVEVTEFPHLGHKYRVMGVPRSVMNETVILEGAVPERYFLQKVLEAAQAPVVAAK